MAKLDCGCDWTGQQWEFCLKHIPPDDLRAKVEQLELQASEQKKKYSDLLQSHASLCGKIEQMKFDHKVFYDAAVDKGLKDAEQIQQLLLQIEGVKKIIHESVVNYRGASIQVAFTEDARIRLADIHKALLEIEAEVLAVFATTAKRICERCRKASATVVRPPFGNIRGENLCAECDK